MILDLLLIILGITITWIGVFSQWWHERDTSDIKKRRQNNINFVISILGGLVIFISGYTSVKDKATSDIDLKQQKNDISNLLKENDSLKRIIKTSSKELVSKVKNLQTDNYKLSRELTNSTLLLSKNFLGSDKLDVKFYRIGDDKACIRVFNNGEFPSYDVTVSVYDMDVMKKYIKNISKDTVFVSKDDESKYIVHYKTINYPLNASIDHTPYFLINSEYRHFSIYLDTRKGQIERHCIVKFNEKNNELIQYYRTYLVKKDKRVFLSQYNPTHISEAYWIKHFFCSKLIYYEKYQSPINSNKN
jgi:hypothetical protein